MRWCVVALLAACAPTPIPEHFDYGVPVTVSAPHTSPERVPTPAKVELGRRLFFERKLSADETFSCASCHRPELAFTDGLAVARGLRGESLPRNTMSLANAGYLDVLTWANPKLHTLEGQALVPLLADAPSELGVARRMPEVLRRLSDDASLRALFERAFPGPEPVTTTHLIAALASFERTLLSYSAPYDAFVRGQPHALSEPAQRGKQLFESQRLRCSSCHSGPLQTDATSEGRLNAVAQPFHNIGLYNIQGRGLYPVNNLGLYEFTHRPGDMGRFRTPSLRNVALTAPYMHDGSIATLDAVLDHYAAGGRTIASGPYAGDGSASRYKDPRIAGFSLSTQERKDLIAFLQSLTDPAFVARAAQIKP